MAGIEPPGDGTKDNLRMVEEQVEKMALQVDEIHRWLVGNGKIGMFERLRLLSMQVKVIGIGTLTLLLDAILSGRISEIVQCGIKLLH